MEHSTTKAPHYFLVGFDETFVSIQGTGIYGTPYVITCDNIPVNVYGFTSELEAKAFDPLKLRRYLIGSRLQQLLIPADTREELDVIIQNDQRVKDGVFTLSTHSMYGPIESLPECKRMFLTREGRLQCGDTEGCGGCILEGFDQEEEFSDGFKCPMYNRRERRTEEVQQEAV